MAFIYAIHPWELSTSSKWHSFIAAARWKLRPVLPRRNGEKEDCTSLTTIPTLTISFGLLLGSALLSFLLAIKVFQESASYRLWISTTITKGTREKASFLTNDQPKFMNNNPCKTPRQCRHDSRGKNRSPLQ